MDGLCISQIAELFQFPYLRYVTYLNILMFVFNMLSFQQQPVYNHDSASTAQPPALQIGNMKPSNGTWVQVQS